MAASFASLLRLDTQLVAVGHHGLTPWWAPTLERFYAHPTARTLVARVGRAGAKSFTAAKIGLNETLFGDWSIPPGERHFWAYVSRNKDEAAQRLLVLAYFLRALGVPFDVSGDEIALRDMPRGFRVFACQVGAVSGFRCYGYSADELAKWQAGTDHANPAAEVCSSLNAMCVTHPGARKLLISSPFGTLDYHYERFERGDAADQVVARAESWVANPDGITEAQTHSAEPDERVWAREYAAIPGDTITGNWFGDAALARAVAPLPDGPAVVRPATRTTRIVMHVSECVAAQGWLQPGGCQCGDGTAPDDPFVNGVRYTIALDQAFQHDRFAWAVASSQLGDWDSVAQRRAPRVTRIHEVGAWRPDRSPREMLRRVRAEVCRRYHTDRVYIDQHGGLAVLELCRDVGLSAVIVPWTGGDGETSKATRYRAVRLAMLEGAFRIPSDPDLLRELREVRGTLLPSGGERIEVPRSALGHGDRVSALVLAGSISLAHSPDLAPSRESEWERRERERKAHELQMALEGGVPGSF
jgi:hypothetical protein